MAKSASAPCAMCGGFVFAPVMDGQPLLMPPTMLMGSYNNPIRRGNILKIVPVPIWKFHYRKEMRCMNK